MLASFFCWVNFLSTEHYAFGVIWGEDDMRIVILGSGVVGVASAWYLAKDGHEVTVIDRQAGPVMQARYHRDMQHLGPRRVYLLRPLNGCSSGMRH